MDGPLKAVPRLRFDSPCVNVCEIMPGTGLCRGCARTIDEIAGWARGTPAWRAAVMRDLPTRRA